MQNQLVRIPKIKATKASWRILSATVEIFSEPHFGHRNSFGIANFVSTFASGAPQEAGDLVASSESRSASDESKTLPHW